MTDNESDFESTHEGELQDDDDNTNNAIEGIKTKKLFADVGCRM